MREAVAEVGSTGLEGLIDGLLEGGETQLYDKATAAVERMLFAKVLAFTKGHQAQASQILGLNRTTLRYKLKSLGLSVDKTLHDGQSRPEVEG
jgi:DNA-binding protein Fis